jgi:uncharacterized protein (TIGR02268 family)
LAQPATLSGVLLLLMMTSAAQAQPESTRARTLALPDSPGAPLPEVHVAASVATLLLFDAPIERSSVQLEATLIRLVDVGEHSVIIEPRVSPGPQEQWVLRVRYSGAQGPEQWATFALVSRPDAVDARVDVVRSQKSLEACQAELAAAKAPTDAGSAEVWMLADRLGGRAVQASEFAERADEGSLETLQGMAYRLATGVLLVFSVSNPSGQQSWTPTAATLRSTNKAQEAVTVLRVAVRQGPIAPGTRGSVAVGAAQPPPPAGVLFELELRDASGRSLTVRRVKIPEAKRLERTDP